MSEAANKIEAVIAEKVNEVAKDPNVPGLTNQAAPQVANAMNDKLGPWILNMTNNEPWYQSRIIWGLLIGGISTIARPIAGEIFSAEQASMWAESAATAGQLAGIGFALYARLTAQKGIPSA